MYSDEIKKYCRTIDTGLKGKINASILESVEGQLSDGMWENSPRMEGYWLFFCVGMEDNKVVLHISKQYAEYRWNRNKYNAFSDMSDYQIKEWFANKIKQIIKQEQKDAWPNHPIEWKRDCEVESMYMHDNITVAQCYKAYDILKGRRVYE